MADEYAYRIQPIRPGMLIGGPTEAEAAVIERHFAYLERALATGTLLMAGRTLTTDESNFGIAVFRAGSPEEARRFTEADPAVQEGVMRAEVFPFRVALLAERWERG
jgi:uncharacterized protein YciI